MTKTNRILSFAGAFGAALCCFTFTARAQDKVVKVGILHSLSGTMAISETSLRDVLLFAFDEINAQGGVMGYKIEPVIVDGASNWPLFAEKAKQLLEEDKVAVTFGCWTSVSRKSVLPVFEKDNGLLFYPVQYEGEELSKNIFYTAEAVNQQATPAVDYLLQQGKKKFYLIGTDYVYPQTTNLILFKYLLLKGVPIENIGGGVSKDDSRQGHLSRQVRALRPHRLPADRGRHQAIRRQRRRLRDQHDQRRLERAVLQGNRGGGPDPGGLPGRLLQPGRGRAAQHADQGPGGRAGLLDLLPVLNDPGQQGLPGQLEHWLGTENYPGVVKEKRAVDSPMVLSYDGVYLWKAAVEKAGSFDVDKVRAVLEAGDISFDGPGGKITMQANHHATKNVYIGETKANGQFKIIEDLPAGRGRTLPAEGSGRTARRHRQISGRPKVSPSVDASRGGSRRARPFCFSCPPSSSSRSRPADRRVRRRPARAAGPTDADVRRQLASHARCQRAPSSSACSASCGNSGSKFAHDVLTAWSRGEVYLYAPPQGASTSQCCWRSSRTPRGKSRAHPDRHGGRGWWTRQGGNCASIRRRSNSVDTDMRLRERHPAGARCADAGRPRPGRPARRGREAGQFAEGGLHSGPARPGGAGRPTRRCARRSTRRSPCSSSAIPTRRCSCGDPASSPTSTPWAAWTA